jgi:hypothetical protein
MVWGKLASEALGTTWYTIEAQWLATDAIFYGCVVGWDAVGIARLSRSAANAC